MHCRFYSILKLYGGFITDLLPMLATLPYDLLDVPGTLRSANSSICIGIILIISYALSNSFVAAAFAAIYNSWVCRARKISNTSNADYDICNACLWRKREIWSFKRILWMIFRFNALVVVQSTLPIFRHRPSQCRRYCHDRKVYVSFKHCTQLALNRFLRSLSIQCQRSQHAARS